MIQGPLDTIRGLLRIRWLLPSVLITLLTLGIVGAVVATTTPGGCGFTNKIGVKSGLCVAASPVARVNSPSPLPQPTITDIPPSPLPPANPPSSNLPPVDYPASAGTPVGSYGSFAFPPLQAGGSGMPNPSPLSCRLPIFVGQPGSGGFIAYPGGNFIADPRSAVAAPSPSPGTPSPAPGYYGPYYPGWWGLTYDATYKKWLPVPYRWTSPDGVHYAYALGGDIYVQNVANGTQLELAADKNLQVLDVADTGVYATSAPGQPGLWFLPYSGTEKQITATGYWLGVSHGYAYGTAVSAVPQGVPTTINRLDVGTGALKAWYTSQPGSNVSLAGFDGSGNPVIQATYQSGVALWVAYSPTNPVGISWNSWGDANPQSPIIADSHGLWVSVGNGIDLYANGTWYLMANLGGQLAGKCS